MNHLFENGLKDRHCRVISDFLCQAGHKEFSASQIISGEFGKWFNSCPLYSESTKEKYYREILSVYGVKHCRLDMLRDRVFPTEQTAATTLINIDRNIESCKNDKRIYSLARDCFVVMAYSGFPVVDIPGLGVRYDGDVDVIDGKSFCSFTVSNECDLRESKRQKVVKFVNRNKVIADVTIRASAAYRELAGEDGIKKLDGKVRNIILEANAAHGFGISVLRRIYPKILP